MKKTIIAATIILALIAGIAFATEGGSGMWMNNGTISGQMGTRMGFGAVSHTHHAGMHSGSMEHSHMNWDQMNQGNCLIKS